MTNLFKIICILVLLLFFIYLYKGGTFEFMTTEEKISNGIKLYKEKYGINKGNEKFVYGYNNNVDNTYIDKLFKYTIGQTNFKTYQIIFTNINNLENLSIESVPSQIYVYENRKFKNIKLKKGTNIIILQKKGGNKLIDIIYIK